MLLSLKGILFLFFDIQLWAMSGNLFLYAGQIIVRLLVKFKWTSFRFTDCWVTVSSAFQIRWLLSHCIISLPDSLIAESLYHQSSTFTDCWVTVSSVFQIHWLPSHCIISLDNVLSSGWISVGREQTLGSQVVTSSSSKLLPFKSSCFLFTHRHRLKVKYFLGFDAIHLFWPT